MKGKNEPNAQNRLKANDSDNKYGMSSPKDLGSNENWMKTITDILKLILLSLSVLFAVATGIQKFFELNYTINAEKFYGIPRKYFCENILGNVNILVIFLLASMFVLCYLWYLKKSPNKVNFSVWERIALSLAFALCVLLILFHFNAQLAELMGLRGRCQPCLVLTISFFGSIFTFVKCFTYLNDKKAIENNDGDSKKTIKDQIYIPVILNIILLLIFSVFLFVRANPTYKKHYEIVRIENADRMLVGEYQGCAILMDVHIDSDKNLTFEKSSYQLEPLNNLDLVYQVFTSVSPK